MTRISTEILNTPVDGVNLQPGGLGDQFDSQRPTLLVFLRHLG